MGNQTISKFQFSQELFSSCFTLKHSSKTSSHLRKSFRSPLQFVKFSGFLNGLQNSAAKNRAHFRYKPEKSKVENEMKWEKSWNRKSWHIIVDLIIAKGHFKVLHNDFEYVPEKKELKYLGLNFDYSDQFPTVWRVTHGGPQNVRNLEIHEYVFVIHFCLSKKFPIHRTFFTAFISLFFLSHL